MTTRKEYSAVDAQPVVLYAKTDPTSQQAYPVVADANGNIATVNIFLQTTPTITALVFGDGVSDGSWRIIPSSSTLSFQVLQGGVWYEKTAITNP